VLSPVIGLSCHRRQRDAKASSPASRQRRGAKTTRLRRPLWLCSSASLERPPHPALHVRDDASAPPDERETREEEPPICPSSQAIDLRQIGTTGKSVTVTEMLSSGSFRALLACAISKTDRIVERDWLPCPPCIFKSRTWGNLVSITKLRSIRSWPSRRRYEDRTMHGSKSDESFSPIDCLGVMGPSWLPDPQRFRSRDSRCYIGSPC
jgi:hypothetical protein